MPVEVDLGGPPSGRAVFKLSPVGEKVVACALGAEGGKVLDLEAAGLFEVVVVGDDIGALLGASGQRDDGENQPDGSAGRNSYGNGRGSAMAWSLKPSGGQEKYLIPF